MFKNPVMLSLKRNRRPKRTKPKPKVTKSKLQKSLVKTPVFSLAHKAATFLTTEALNAPLKIPVIVEIARRLLKTPKLATLKLRPKKSCKI